MSAVDVLVVGAGVAGCTAAIGLARQGLGVTLVDRAELPRHKVCGCCLNSAAVRVLDELQLARPLRLAGATPIDRIEVFCEKRSLALSSRGGLAVSRYTLDQTLRRAAIDAGCTVYDQTAATIERLPPDSHASVSVRCQSRRSDAPHHIDAQIVLVADGLAGSCTARVDSAKRLTRTDSLRGYGTRLPAGQHIADPGSVAMLCGTGGYVGTVVLEDGSLDIAAAMNPRWVKACRGPAQAAQTLAKRSGRPLPAFAQEAIWKATAPLTSRRKKLWMPRVFFLGDSAGYVEPFTGEGMAWAMKSAVALQPLVPHAIERWDDRIGRDWQCAHRHAVQTNQWRCKLFSKALRRPKLISTAIRLANAMPPIARQSIASSCLPPMFASTPEPSTTEPTPT